MRAVTYSMSISLDGYIVGPDGGFDWSTPDDEVFRLAIDEYRIRVYPILVGGGISFFAQHGRQVDLDLVESRTFDSQVLYLRYRVVR